MSGGEAPSGPEGFELRGSVHEGLNKFVRVIHHEVRRNVP